MSNLSRREFLVGASGFAAGATVGAVLGGGVLDLFPATAKAAQTSLPWPYVQLDVEKARIRGYKFTKSSGS
ncbi:MAG: hypothetical protein GX058_01770 [Firmicutes bacterium]|nr:hypothetical protein [Bacillota bacterium]